LWAYRRYRGFGAVTCALKAEEASAWEDVAMAGDDKDTELVVDFEGMALEQQMAATADYVARGRQYADMPGETLFAEWIAAFKAFVDALLKNPKTSSQGREDLEAELTIMGLPVPYDQVQAAAKRRSSLRRGWLSWSTPTACGKSRPS